MKTIMGKILGDWLTGWGMQKGHQTTNKIKTAYIVTFMTGEIADAIHL